MQPPDRTAEPDHRPWSLVTFSADVTIPIGHPCMGGGISPARSVVDPLEAIGFVLSGGTLDKPIVLVSVDWCEIRGEAYDAWRDSLAEVAGTDRERVLVTAVHQHDAPVMDPAAQRILEAQGAAGAVCDIAFGELAVARVAGALRDAMRGPTRTVTHLGVGRARGGAGRVEPPVRPAGRIDLVSPDQRVARAGGLRRPGGDDRPLADDDLVLGRRSAPAGPEPLRRPPDELLRERRGVGGLHRCRPAGPNPRPSPA